MSLLSELITLLSGCGISVETGIFSDKAPDSYLVITPLTETFELHADNTPGCETITLSNSFSRFSLVA